MAMGDPNWVSLLPGPPAGNALDAYNKGTEQGIKTGQTLATRSALQNINIDDAASINRGIGALMRAGANDVAQGVLTLNGARVMQQAKLPLYQAIGARTLSRINGAPPAAPATPTPPAIGDLTPEQHAHVLETLDAMDAIDQKISSLPYAQRKAALAAEAPTLHDRGMDPSLIEGFDPTDENIARARQDHAALREQIAGLQQQQGGATTQAAPAAQPGVSPGYSIADANLRDPLYSDPASVGIMKEMGIDPSDTLNRDVTITGPMRSEEAKVANARALKTQEALAPPAATITSAAVADPRSPTGYRITTPPGGIAAAASGAGATALGTMAGSHGGEVGTRSDGTPIVVPVQGAARTAAGYDATVAGAKTSAEATAGAPSKVITLQTPDGGSVAGTWVNGPNGWHFQEVQGGSGGTPGVGHAPSPQQAAMNKASADQLIADRQTAGQLQATLVPLRTVYDTLAKPGVTIGPGTHTLNTWRSFVQSNLPLLQGFVGANEVQIADYDKLTKYMRQIADVRSGQFGAGTNEKLAIAASGSPNPDMSNLGAREVARMNIALARAEAAKSATYNGPPENYASYAADYGRTVDPRAFMLDMLSKTERKALLDSIPRGTPEGDAFLRGVAIAKSAGYIPK